jgi:hypothetical protein
MPELSEGNMRLPDTDQQRCLPSPGHPAIQRVHASNMRISGTGYLVTPAALQTKLADCLGK